MEAIDKVQKIIDWLRRLRPELATEFKEEDWFQPSRELLNDYVYICIIEGDAVELRKAVLSKLFCGQYLDLILTKPANNFRWRNVNMPGRTFFFNVCPLSYACILGRYSCVRVLLEEFPWTYRSHPYFNWHVYFMDLKMSLPFAMESFDLFPPSRPMTDLTVMVRAWHPHLPHMPASEELRQLKFKCRTDNRQKQEILQLLHLYSPKMTADDARLVPLRAAASHHHPMTARFFHTAQMMQMIGIPPTFIIPNSRTAPTLLRLVFRFLLNRLVHPKQKEEFRRRMEGLIPSVLLDTLINKEMLL